MVDDGAGMLLLPLGVATNPAWRVRAWAFEDFRSAPPGVWSAPVQFILEPSVASVPFHRFPFR